MVKYKLIKEYPQSPKLGTIAVQDNHRKHEYYYHGLFDDEIICQTTLDNYPDFWKKMEELCVPVGTYFIHYDAYETELYRISKITDDLKVHILSNGKTIEDYEINDVNMYIREKIWLPIDITIYLENQELFTAKEIEEMWDEVIFSRVTDLRAQLKKKLKEKLEEKLENGK